MKINEAESLAGITKKNIRFYEEQGLLEPGRGANGYREYSDEDVMTLRKIKLLRKLGVPIEEIRSLKEKNLSLADCLERRKAELGREAGNIEIMKTMCGALLENSLSFELLEPDALLEKMDSLEKGGEIFVNVVNKDVRKKKAGALISALVMGAFLLAWIIVALVFAVRDGMPLALAVLVSVMPAVIITGIVIALRQRYKEISGGEEDEASKY